MIICQEWFTPFAAFKNKVIIDLTADEDEHLTFHLENGVMIKHTVHYGDQLFISSRE